MRWNPFLEIFRSVTRARGHDDNSLILILGRNLIGVRHRGDARSAPRGPEVEDHHLALEIGELHRLAGDVLHGEVRRNGSGVERRRRGLRRGGLGRRHHLGGQRGRQEGDAKRAEQEYVFHEVTGRQDAPPAEKMRGGMQILKKITAPVAIAPA